MAVLSEADVSEDRRLGSLVTTRRLLTGSKQLREGKGGCWPGKISFKHEEASLRQVLEGLLHFCTLGRLTSTLLVQVSMIVW